MRAGAALWGVLLVTVAAGVVTAAVVNCNTTSLPQHTATPEYLLLYIDRVPRPFVVLTTDTTVTANVSVFNSSSATGGYIHFDGYTAEPWSFRVETKVVSSYNEHTDPPTLTHADFVIISGNIGKERLYSVHHIADPAATACSVFGTKIAENAPIVSTETANGPLDALVQAPLALALLSTSNAEKASFAAAASRHGGSSWTLDNVLCPHLHDTPNGKMSYVSPTVRRESLPLVQGRLLPTGGVDPLSFVNATVRATTLPVTEILLESDAWNGVPIPKLLRVSVVNETERSFSGLSRVPLMTSPAGGNSTGFPTLAFYPWIPFPQNVFESLAWCNTSSAAPSTACVKRSPVRLSGNIGDAVFYDAVLRHLRLLPDLLRRALTVRINTTHAVVPIHAGAPNSLGTLENTICPGKPPRFNFSAVAPTVAFESTLKTCTTSVADPEDTVALYCASPPGGAVFHLDTNTGVLLRPVREGCPTGRISVLSVGVCGVASVCVETGRVSVKSLSSSGTVAAPWGNWTFDSAYTVRDIRILPADIHSGACGDDDGLWRAFVHVQHRVSHASFLWRYSGGAAVTPTTVQSSAASALFLFDASHDLFRNILFNADTTAVTVAAYWAATAFPGSAAYNNDEAFLVTVSCTRPSASANPGCSVTILSTVGGDADTTTAVHTDLRVPLRLDPQTTVFAHAHVHANDPSLSSFAVGATEGDVLVFAHFGPAAASAASPPPLTVSTCFVGTAESSLYCESRETNVTKHHGHRLFFRKQGQLLLLDAGPHNRYLFNAASFVRTTTSLPSDACWTDASYTADATAVTKQTLSVGGPLEYARQYVSAVPNATFVIDLVFNNTNGNTVVVYATTHGIESRQLTGTSCYLGQAAKKPPSATQLHALFPSVPCVDVSGITDDPVSVYIGTDGTTGCTAAQHDSSGCTAITVPALRKSEYYDPADKAYCDGTTQPEFARRGDPNPNTDLLLRSPDNRPWTRNVFDYRNDPLNPEKAPYCTTVHQWYNTGTPNDLLLAYTRTPAFFGSFDLCVPRERAPASALRSHVRLPRTPVGNGGADGPEPSPTLITASFLLTSDDDATGPAAALAFKEVTSRLWTPPGQNDSDATAVCGPACAPPDLLWTSAKTVGVVLPSSVRASPPRAVCTSNAYAARASRQALGDDGFLSTTSVVSALYPAANTSAAKLIPATKCVPLTNCTVGSSYEAVPPRAAHDRVCFPVTQCYPTLQYESAAPTFTTDRVCSPTTLYLSSSYHITVGATPTTDNVFRRVVSHCNDGSYLNTSANANAKPGGVVNGTRCVACPEGFTAYNPRCADTEARLLDDVASWNPATCSSFHLYHAQTSCTTVETAHVCGPEMWYNSTASPGHATRNCFRCKVCGVTTVSAECTLTTDRVCSNIYLDSVASSSAAAQPGVQQCPARTYRNAITSECLPCTRCLQIKSRCTRTHDTVCASFSVINHVFEIVFILIVLFAVWMSVFRIILPIREVARIHRLSSAPPPGKSPPPPSSDSSFTSDLFRELGSSSGADS